MSAAAIEALLAGNAADRWEFAEFPWLSAVPLVEAVSRILEGVSGDIASILMHLHRRGHLAALLAGLNEFRLEELIRRLDEDLPISEPLDLHALMQVADLLVQHTQPRSLGREPTSRRAILTLWAELRTQEVGRWSPALVAAALRAGRILAEALGRPSRQAAATAIAHALEDGTPHDATGHVLGLILRLIAASMDGDASARTSLAMVAEKLAGRLGSPVPVRLSTSRIVASDAAGLLLLVPSIIRLGWPEAVAGTQVWTEWGPRSFAYILAGIGQELLGRQDDAFDPAVVMLAGPAAEYLPAGYHTFFETLTEEEGRALTGVLCGARPTDDAPAWRGIVSAAADALVSEFVVRIRGFNKSSRAFVVEKLLAVPGEIEIDDRKILVSLAASPFHVALHVSSAFDAVSDVKWLGSRDVIYHPGG